MSSQAQIAANRRNAKRSTGPRTPDGKARIAHNAVCHGLASRIVAGKPATDRVACLVNLFIGDGPRNVDIQAAARIAAEAQCVIEQVRLRKSMLFNLTTPVVPPYRSPPLMKAAARAKHITESADDTVLGPAKQFNLTTIARIEASEPSWQPTTELDREALVFQEVALKLERLDRYERRAMSRRNAALVEIERLRAQPNRNAQPAT